MKAEALHKGMIFEKVIRKVRHSALPKGAKVFEDQLYQILDCGRREIDGYSVDSIFLGNLSDKSGVMTDFTTLMNPNEWRYHQGAFLEEEKKYIEIYTRRVQFLDDSPTIELDTIETILEKTEEEVGVSTEKKLEAELKNVEAPPKTNVVVIPVEPKASEPEDDEDSSPKAVEATPFHAYGWMTIEHVEQLVDTFMTMEIINTPVPAAKSAKNIFIRQDWDGFYDRQYTIREVREHAVRMDDPNNPHKLGYRQVIKRLMLGLNWFGKGEHAELKTRFIQKHIFDKRKTEDQ